MTSGLLLGGCDFFAGSRGRATTPQGDTGQAASHVRAYGEPWGYDGIITDDIETIRSTTDGGYIVAGTGGRFDPDRRLMGSKIWAVKTTADGSVAWQARYVRYNSSDGRPVNARANAMERTRDGGYVIAGRCGDSALVMKLKENGDIAWQWFRTGENVKNEALALHVSSDGTIAVAGATFRMDDQNNDPAVDYAWVMSIDDHGETFDDGWVNRVITGGWPSAITWTDGGNVLVAGAIPAASRRVSESLKWAARLPLDSFGGGPVQWFKTYGTGRFLAAASQGDGFILAGSAANGPVVYELAADGTLTVAHEFRSPDGGSMDERTVREASSIRLTDDGYLLAGTYADDSDYAGFAWAAKVTRGAGTARAIQWQINYVGPGIRNNRNLNSGAYSIDTGGPGGFRLAGHVSYYTEYPGGGGADSFSGWVLDLGYDGSVQVNPVSGIYQLPTNAVHVDVTNSVTVADQVPLEDISAGIDDKSLSMLAEATDALIETMSGPTGALSAPRLGTNSPGQSFYWLSVPEASGYIVFGSQDRTTFRRLVNRLESGASYPGVFDIPSGTTLFKVVAFDAAGYSDFSSAAELEDEEPLPDQITLFVLRSGADGSVESSPPGIRCPTACSQTFARSASGTQVILTAFENDISEFESWQGCDSVGGAQCTLVMTDANRSVTANFRPKTTTTPN
jgi:hypothetical protein